MGKRFTIVLAALAVGVLLAACSDTPSSFGRAYRGRSLDVTVLALDRLPELRYTNSYPGGGVDHHRLLPSEEGNELVLVRLSVANHTATSHIVDVNDEAAELQDFLAHPIVEALPVDSDSSWHFAEMVADLRAAGTPLPTNDIWIAAVAARSGALVLTYDRHFEKIVRVGAMVLE